jgi:hypothetical protein
MTTKTIGLVIIALIFIFPFRWVYLEYPDPIDSQGTMIDAGRIEYVFYFILCVAGFLTFMLMSTSDSNHEQSNH